MKDKRALFLDRDGVIIEDVHLLTKWSDVKLMPDILELLSFALESGLSLIMVTNQTVVSRGLVTLDEAHSINLRIIELIEAKMGLSNIFTGVYLCPFHPKATLAEYRVDSPLRKPRPGMLLKAKEEYNIILERSFLVGDRVSDIIAGNLVKCHTALVEGAMSNMLKIESTLEVNQEMETPDFKAKNLDEVKNWIRGLL